MGGGVLRTSTESIRITKMVYGSVTKVTDYHLDDPDYGLIPYLHESSIYLYFWGEHGKTSSMTAVEGVKLTFKHDYLEHDGRVQLQHHKQTKRNLAPYQTSPFLARPTVCLLPLVQDIKQKNNKINNY